MSLVTCSHDDVFISSLYKCRKVVYSLIFFQISVNKIFLKINLIYLVTNIVKNKMYTFIILIVMTVTYRKHNFNTNVKFLFVDITCL